VDNPTAQISVPEQWLRNAPRGDSDAVAEAPSQSSDSDSDSDSEFGLSAALIGAPLLAAGVLGALGRRRRMVLWQSAMTAVAGRRGMEPPVPTGDEADVHDALLVGADRSSSTRRLSVCGLGETTSCVPSRSTYLFCRSSRISLSR
jgi:hypothetical protein